MRDNLLEDFKIDNQVEATTIDKRIADTHQEETAEDQAVHKDIEVAVETIIDKVASIEDHHMITAIVEVATREVAVTVDKMTIDAVAEMITEDSTTVAEVVMTKEEDLITEIATEVEISNYKAIISVVGQGRDPREMIDAMMTEVVTTKEEMTIILVVEETIEADTVVMIEVATEEAETVVVSEEVAAVTVAASEVVAVASEVAEVVATSTTKCLRKATTIKLK